MSQEDPAIQIHNLILKKDSITTSTDKIQEEVPKIMKTKEKINMAILVKEMIDLKDQITISILKKWIREKDPLTIIQKEDFKAKDLLVLTEIKMIKKEDSKIEEAKTLTEKMETLTSQKMIDALIVRKKVTLQESARSLLMETTETWEEDITLIEAMDILKVIVKTIDFIFKLNAFLQISKINRFHIYYSFNN